MRTLAFDLSSKSTGWAHFEDGTLIAYGLLKPTVKGEWGGRLDDYATLLRLLLLEINPTHVIIEDIYRGPSAVTFKVLSFFHGVTYQIVKELLGIEPERLGVLSIRKQLADAGGVKSCRTKEQAFFIMNQTFGEKFDFKKDNDIVDALALTYGYYFMHDIIPSCSLKFDKAEYEKVSLSKPKKKRKSRKKSGSLQSTELKKKRKQRGSKKSIPEASKKISPRHKSGQ